MRPTILGLESNEVVLLVECFIFIQNTSNGCVRSGQYDSVK